MTTLTDTATSNVVKKNVNIPTFKVQKSRTSRLKKEQKFRCLRAEFFVLSFQIIAGKREVRTLCYKGSKETECLAGDICVFDNDVEIDLLEEVVNG